MALPMQSPGLTPASDARVEEEWFAVARMVEEICRALADALPGAPTAVDCTAGLEIPAGELGRLRRSVTRLVVRTAVGVGTGGVEVVARPAGSKAAPALLFAVQAISKERRTIRGGTGFDPEELALAGELVERGGGRVLITRQLLGERRSMLGIDARWRVGRGETLCFRSPSRATAEQQQVQVPAASSSAVPPAPPRYAAAEMPYSLSR